jgi:hypothetical protein
MRTEKQEIFIEQYCLHGCAAKAAQIAGYSHPKQRGYELKNQFAREIEDRTRKMIQDCVPGALMVLKNLSEGAESESVRLGAVLALSRIYWTGQGLNPLRRSNRKFHTLKKNLQKSCRGN